MASLLNIGDAVPGAGQASGRRTNGSGAAVQPLDILVAEDNRSNRDLLVRILTRLGHRADVANNGRDAVAAVEQRPYDVVLMDVRMPVSRAVGR